MYKKLIKTFIISVLFFSVFLFDAFGSHWAQELFASSIHIRRICTLGVYLPFIIAIGQKVISDFKCREILVVENIFYYLFIIYYFIVTIYRFMMHGEYKESIYFFIVFIGSASLVIEIFRKQIFSQTILIKNIRICCIITAVYRIIILFIVPQIFSYPPVNINIISSLAVLFFAFFSYCLSIQQQDNKWINIVLLFLSTTIILSSGSRASFILLIILVLFSTVYFLLMNKKLFLIFGSTVLSSVILIAVLSAFNIGDVRPSVVREIWILNRFIENVEENTEDLISPIDDTKIQNQQIERSDVSRRDLIEMGVQQVYINPIFGTGDVLYQQNITKTYTANQTSHCFIIESLVCFGVIGSIISILMISIPCMLGLSWKSRNVIFFIIITLIVHLLFCLVQPLFFDPIVSIVFTIIMSCLGIGLGKRRLLIESQNSLEAEID